MQGMCVRERFSRSNRIGLRIVLISQLLADVVMFLWISPCLKIQVGHIGQWVITFFSHDPKVTFVCVRDPTTTTTVRAPPFLPHPGADGYSAVHGAENKRTADRLKLCQNFRANDTLRVFSVVLVVRVHLYFKKSGLKLASSDICWSWWLALLRRWCCCQAFRWFTLRHLTLP